MKKLVLALSILLAGSVFAGIAPRQNFSSDTSKTVTKRSLTIMQGSDWSLGWGFTNASTAVNLTGCTPYFYYSPTGRAWIVTVTGAVDVATNGSVLFSFVPSQLNTNGTYDWVVEVKSNATVLAYAYGNLTILENVSDTAVAALPAGTNFNWALYTTYQNGTNGAYIAGSNITFRTNASGQVLIDGLSTNGLVTSAITNDIATSLQTHQNLTGTSVHGLGTMSTATASDYSTSNQQTVITGNAITSATNATTASMLTYAYPSNNPNGFAAQSQYNVFTSSNKFSGLVNIGTALFLDGALSVLSTEYTTTPSGNYFDLIGGGLYSSGERFNFKAQYLTNGVWHCEDAGSDKDIMNFRTTKSIVDTQIWTVAQMPSQVVTNNGVGYNLGQIVNNDGTNYNGEAYAEKAWVRSLLGGGVLLYNVGSPHPSNSAWYIASYTTNATQEMRSYTNITAGNYLGYGIMSTSKFTSIQSPMNVDAYLALETAGGGRSYTIAPEFYYTYGTGDIATLQGDYTSAGQTITSASTNLYSWTISFPNVTATNGAGFFVCRRFKVLASAGVNPVIRVHGSGTTPSHISFASSSYDPSLGTRGATNVITGTTSSYNASTRVMTLGSFTNIASVGFSASSGVTNGSLSLVMLNGGTNYMSWVTQTNANGACQTNLIPISTR